MSLRSVVGTKTPAPPERAHAKPPTTGTPLRHRGDGMLHPLILSALALLLLNDHVGKARFAGVVTGKLSDCCGLVFFPVLLWSLLEVLLRRAPLSRRTYVAIVVVTGAFFALAKTRLEVALVYRRGIALLQWPVHAVAALVQGRGWPAVGDVAFVMDPTDLVALVFLLVPLWLGLRRSSAP